MFFTIVLVSGSAKVYLLLGTILGRLNFAVAPRFKAERQNSFVGLIRGLYFDARCPPNVPFGVVLTTTPLFTCSFRPRVRGGIPSSGPAHGPGGASSGLHGGHRSSLRQ